MVQAFIAPASLGYPVGPIVFALMAVFSRYLLQYMIDKYELKVNKDEFYKCSCCDGIFRPKQNLLTNEKEKERNRDILKRLKY